MESFTNSSCLRSHFFLPHVMQPTHFPQVTLDDATDSWGIKVERVEIKDVKLPHQLQRAMAAEAEATREARAKVRDVNLRDLSLWALNILTCFYFGCLTWWIFSLKTNYSSK